MLSLQTDVEQVKVTKDTVDNISLQVSIEMPFDIRSLTSPTHKVKVKKTASKAVVELPKNSTLDAGFQLQIGLAEIHVPRMWVENEPKSDSRACMLTFYPEFDAKSMEETEIILLLDCSNSMKGDPIEAAKKVLLLALDVLPEQYKFNIAAFGTNYTELFPQSVKKSEKVLTRAVAFVQVLQPSEGNTDVWRPLQMLHQLPPGDKMRNIFLISDGHLNQAEMTLGMIRRNAAHSRLFTLGVGSSANAHLMKSAALNGHGCYEFYDTATKSKWEGKVRSQIQKSSQPSLSNVRVDWQTYGEDEARQAPRQLTSLFNGSRQVVYGFVKNCTQVRQCSSLFSV